MEIVDSHQSIRPKNKNRILPSSHSVLQKRDEAVEVNSGLGQPKMQPLKSVSWVSTVIVQESLLVSMKFIAGQFFWKNKFEKLELKQI